MDFLLLIALILLNGIFAMSEIAILTARKSALLKLSKEGRRGATIALKLMEDPTNFLSTVQIGITSIGLLNGIVGYTIFTEPLTNFFIVFGMPVSIVHVFTTILVVGGVTYLSIVVGEITPKRIGQIFAEKLACFISPPMYMLLKISSPFVWLLAVSTKILIRIMGLGNARKALLTEEEIHAILAEGRAAGVIEHNEHTMLRNVFRLDDRPITSLMVPRSEIVFINIDDDKESIIQKVTESQHSWFPVYKGDANNVLGVVNGKEILTQILNKKALNLKSIILPCAYLPEIVSGMSLLQFFKSSGFHLALVVDEYSELQGLVTVQDVMESLIGAFPQTNEEMAEAICQDDGTWLLDGLLPVPELKDYLQIEHLPEEDMHRYFTLSGLLMMLLGKVPKNGDVVELYDWQFKVIEMDGHRVDKVIASKLFR